MFLNNVIVINYELICAVRAVHYWGQNRCETRLLPGLWSPEPSRDRSRGNKNFKRGLLPNYKSQHHDIWCTSGRVIFSFHPNFVDFSVPHEARQRRVKFWRRSDNIPPASVPVRATCSGASLTDSAFNLVLLINMTKSNSVPILNCGF